MAEREDPDLEAEEAAPAPEAEADEGGDDVEQRARELGWVPEDTRRGSGKPSRLLSYAKVRAEV